VKTKKIWASGPEDYDDWWTSSIRESDKNWEVGIDFPRQNYQYYDLDHLREVIFALVKKLDPEGYVGPTYAIFRNEEAAMCFYMTYVR
jgi:hypothetical protein